ncbi:MAG: ferrous iron transport protein B [Saprospiraceae bacterium]|nr:ferrous iron transport protein B [Saprospiraceae bacterium]
MSEDFCSSGHLVALVGNPNSGKSSIFNHLTGLRQQVGNFPGVTVDKKIGEFKFANGQKACLIDFPGTYSFYPTSHDGKVVVQILADQNNKYFPDLFVYVADVTQLERHLLFFHQIQDLNRPVILALNMIDLAQEAGITYNTKALSAQLGCDVVEINGRSKEGMDDLLKLIDNNILKTKNKQRAKCWAPLSNEASLCVEDIAPIFPQNEPYQNILLAHHYQWLPGLTKEQRHDLDQIVVKNNFKSLQEQVIEINHRFNVLIPILNATLKRINKGESFTDKLDNVLTNAFFGPVIFFSIMFLLFQAIFDWSSYPMAAIESLFSYLTSIIESTITTDTWWRNLITEGILAGLSGIFVFIPQIAILFFVISLLEEVGYMARIVFLFDRFMMRFGMNGRSIVALISGSACAIPAIMSTRTINNWKERLITIMVTPLISCSARIPVYITLIGLAFPVRKIFGFVSIQALAFMSLYLLGILSSFIAAFVMNKFYKVGEPSYLLLELPEYRPPMMKNVMLTVWNKIKTFVTEAGKIIFIISIILWFATSYGPSNKIALAAEMARKESVKLNMDEIATKNYIASRKIEYSYSGYLGRFIEPVIEPLGFDWKIGIALITSFAAREVFVGTMGTIYAVGSDEGDIRSIRTKMAADINPMTMKPVYTLPTSISLLLFYVFALQCMSTIAVVKKETNSWFWPILQFVFMGALAYIFSWIAYQYLS